MDLVAHGKGTHKRAEYKGSISVRAYRSLHLQLNIAKTWTKRASEPTRDKEEVLLDEGNEFHFFLTFDEETKTIHGNFTGLKDFSPIMGKCILTAHEPKQKTTPEKYNNAEVAIYSSKEEITQLFNFNSTLAEFFKNDINID
jgi:predicted HicB family RNase H-like nuclease